MAIISVCDVRGGDGGDAPDGDRTKRTYTRRLLVTTDAKADTSLQVLAAAGVPKRGESWSQQGSIDTRARCDTVKAVQNRRSPFVWTVIAKYSTTVPDFTAPETYPNEQRWYFEEEEMVLEYDADDDTKAATSTAGERFEDPIVYPESILVREISFYEFFFDELNYPDYYNTINDATWDVVYPERTVRVAGISSEEIFQEGDDIEDPTFKLNKTTFVFKIKKGRKRADGTYLGWTHRQLDHGTYYLLGGDITKKRKFETVEGHGRLGLLNGVDGDALVGADPQYFEINKYRAVDFDEFPVP